MEASGAAPFRGPAARPVLAGGSLPFEDQHGSIGLRVLSTYHDLAPSRPCVRMKGADGCLWNQAWTGVSVLDPRELSDQDELLFFSELQFLRL